MNDRTESTAEPPPLRRDRAFWGLHVTQFLGAFNDNVFKQVILLLFVQAPAANGQTRDLQWLATLVFSLPFVVFSGLAGYLSDRNAKSRLIVRAKGAEVAIMGGGLAVFLWHAQVGLTPQVIAAFCVVLFLMGSQSTFFSPPKYGILPEMLRRRDLPRANGILLMGTFLAIILGTALAGRLRDAFADALGWIGGICVALAVMGLATSLLIRRTAIARPDLRFQWDALAIPADLRQLLRTDRLLRQAVTATIVFWSAASMVMMVVNAFGKNQLGLSDTATSLLVASTSLGIAIGCIVAGAASRDRFSARVLQCGIWGMIVCLSLLAIPTPMPNRHLLGFAGSVPVLIALGAFTGMFAVPMQVFLQSRPPEGFKGRMIATQNLLNWIGITSSAPLYLLAERSLSWFGLPPCGMFAVCAVLLLGLALWYAPQDQMLT